MGTSIGKYYSDNRNVLIDYVCRQLQGDRITAEDMVQETFLRLCSRCHLINTTTLPAFCYTTLRHLVIDHLRKKAVRSDCEHELRLGNQTPEVFSVLSIQEINRSLEHSIARLDPCSRDIIRLSIVEGRKVSEITNELHMKYKTVENKLGLARKMIRNQVSRLCV